MTFGIVPSYAEAGYGYIKASQEFKTGKVDEWASLEPVVLDVIEFVEKPDAKAARHYLESGEYFWNSVMFMFRASRYLSELEAFRPDILQSCREAIADSNPDLDFFRVDTKAFSECPSESIDYAVWSTRLTQFW